MVLLFFREVQLLLHKGLALNLNKCYTVLGKELHDSHMAVVKCRNTMTANGYVLAMVGHWKTSAQYLHKCPIESRMLSLLLTAPLLPIRC